jgi:predicted membrane channel-forming protein YqfA (hemolysin III family)
LGDNFSIFPVLDIGFCWNEYADMLKSNGHQVSLPLLIGSIVAVVLLRIFSNPGIELLVLPVILAIFGVFSLWKYEQGDHQAFQSMVFQSFGVFYIGVLGAFGITLITLEQMGICGYW